MQVVIAVPQGITPTHQEYAGRVRTLVDFIGDGKNGVDCDGHGTHVAGTVGGKTVGIAKNVTLHAGMPCKL